MTRFDPVVARMLAIALCGLLVGTAHQAMAQKPDAAVPVAPSAEAVVGAYRLGAGDKVKVTTFGEESLTGEFNVSGSGMVALPLVGEVKAQGLTTTELQQSIETALKDGYLREPRVSVQVLTYRPFYILGEVNKPGEYPYTNGLTVLNAVATANGFTYRANSRRVRIRRVGETEEKEYEITSTSAVAPGDTIRIRERLF